MLLLDSPLRVATTVGALVTRLVSLTCSTFQCFALTYAGSLQCPLVCLLGFMEDLTVGMLPSSDPGSKAQSVDWAMQVQHCGLPLAPLWFSGTLPLPQVAPQGGEDVVGNFSHPLWPIGWWARWSP